MKIHPAWQQLLCAFSILLGSCSEAAPTNPVRAPKVVHPGWRIAEIGMVREDHDSGGISEVVTTGDRVLANTSRGALFLGKEGLAWKRLTMPDSAVASALYEWNGLIIVGSRFFGKLYAYSPVSDEWRNLHTERFLPTATRLTKVERIGSFRGGLFVSFGTVRDTLVMGLRSDASLVSWSPMLQGLPPYEIPIAFLDLDSVLLAATFEKGIYQWKLGDSAWTKAVNPQWQPPYSGSTPKPPTEDAPFARAFAKLGNRMWCGLMVDRLFYKDNGDAMWSKFAPDSFAKKIPVDIFAMLTWRGRLFAAGRSHSVPLMHDPVTGSWKTTDVNFCYDIYHEKSVCDYYTTWSMAATSDTLYAASGGVLLKIGWPDLP